MIAIDTLFNRRSILVICGTGGVGKTSVSTLLAIAAAKTGKKTLVVTIDPSNRLKTALSLDHSTAGQVINLTPSLQANLSGEVKGSLSAVIPDSKRVFDQLVRNLTKNEGIRNRIFSNRLYQTFTTEYSGAHEYMALQNVLDYSKNDAFDLIILDTPPSHNILQILQAPRLLARFFEEEHVRRLVDYSNKFLGKAIGKTIGILERLTGQGFIADLFSLAEHLLEIRTEFVGNLQEIDHLIHSERVGFLAVCRPNQSSAAGFLKLKEHLSGANLRYDGLIFNRSLLHLKESVADEKTARHFQWLREAVAKEEALHQEFSSQEFFALLPELNRDMQDFRDYCDVASTLFRN